MGLIDRLAGTSEARNNHRAARHELAAATRDAITNHDGEQTDRYITANDRVVAAEQQLPRWRRNN